MNSEWPKRSPNVRRSLEFTSDVKKKPQQQSSNGGGKGGYVKSQVHMITTNNHLTAVEPSTVKVKRYSASGHSNDMNTERVNSGASNATSNKMPIPKPSKSTPLVEATNVTVTAKTTATEKKTTSDNKMKYYTDYTNRKASLKKMGSCALTVESDDGTSAVYVSL